MRQLQGKGNGSERSCRATFDRRWWLMLKGCGSRLRVWRPAIPTSWPPSPVSSLPLWPRPIDLPLTLELEKCWCHSDATRPTGGQCLAPPCACSSPEGPSCGAAWAQATSAQNSAALIETIWKLIMPHLSPELLVALAHTLITTLWAENLAKTCPDSWAPKTARWAVHVVWAITYHRQ